MKMWTLILIRWKTTKMIHFASLNLQADMLNDTTCLLGQKPLDKVHVIGAGKRGMEIMYKPFLLNYKLSLIYKHRMHTFYILDFSCLVCPLSAVCCYLLSLCLFFGKAHTGVGWVALLACFGSSLLFLQQNHLFQGQVVGIQTHLLTLNLCHVGGSEKDSLCEG